MTVNIEKGELRARLDPIQYAVTQEAATEPAFTGVYWDNHDAGTYRCVVCHTALFDSDTKFESGTGWPSFYDIVANGRVVTEDDRSHGMLRTEVRCGNCGAHLGHLFPDGPRPTTEHGLLAGPRVGIRRHQRIGEDVSTGRPTARIEVDLRLGTEHK